MNKTYPIITDTYIAGIKDTFDINLSMGEGAQAGALGLKNYMVQLWTAYTEGDVELVCPWETLYDAVCLICESYDNTYPKPKPNDDVELESNKLHRKLEITKGLLDIKSGENRELARQISCLRDDLANYEEALADQKEINSILRHQRENQMEAFNEAHVGWDETITKLRTTEDLYEELKVSYESLQFEFVASQNNVTLLKSIITGMNNQLTEVITNAESDLLNKG